MSSRSLERGVGLSLSHERAAEVDQHAFGEIVGVLPVVALAKLFVGRHHALETVLLQGLRQDAFDQTRPALPAVTAHTVNTDQLGDLLAERGQVLPVDVIDHTQHDAGRALRLPLVRGKVDLGKTRWSRSLVTKLAPHTQRKGEALHPHPR